MSVSLEELRSLFKTGNTEELNRLCNSFAAQTSDNEYLPVFSAFASCGEILRQYKKNTDDLLFKFNKNATHSFFSKLVLGKNEFYTNPIHETYYQDMDRAVDALKEAVQSLPEGDALRSEISAAAVRLLMEPTPKEKPDMRFLLTADDAYALRLLPFISTEELAALKEEYLSYYPKKKNRLPNQENLLNEIKKLIG